MACRLSFTRSEMKDSKMFSSNSLKIRYEESAMFEDKSDISVKEVDQTSLKTQLHPKRQD